jgi:hypothetical protein
MVDLKEKLDEIIKTDPFVRPSKSQEIEARNLGQRATRETQDSKSR